MGDITRASLLFLQIINTNANVILILYNSSTKKLMCYILDIIANIVFLLYFAIENISKQSCGDSLSNSLVFVTKLISFFERINDSMIYS